MSGSVAVGSQDEVLFHPDYSCGTAAIRGEEPFELGCQHYWEIKMTSAVYGTDMVRHVSGNA
jgi:SPRY domain-containing SOCS box protein 3